VSIQSEKEKLTQLIIMAWGILFGIFVVVLFGMLFVINEHLHRIERHAIVDDSYRSTVEALELNGE
jgi:hypothetical protein